MIIIEVPGQLSRNKYKSLAFENGFPARKSCQIYTMGMLYWDKIYICAKFHTNHLFGLE